MHSKRAYSIPAASKISTDAFIVSIVCIPVDIITGWPIRAIWRINGRLSASPEPILKPTTSSSFKKSAAAREKGVLAFGNVNDMNKEENGTDVVVTSALWHMEAAIAHAISLVKAGNFDVTITDSEPKSSF